jgi:hypothetical protein
VETRPFYQGILFAVGPVLRKSQSMSAIVDRRYELPFSIQKTLNDSASANVTAMMQVPLSSSQRPEKDLEEPAGQIAAVIAGRKLFARRSV